MKNTNTIFKGNLSIAQKAIIWAIRKPWGKHIHRISMILDKKPYSMGNSSTIGGIDFYSASFRGMQNTPVWSSPMIRVVFENQLYIVK
jgi:hypothetical protein